MKETLKIEINDDNELQNEVQGLLFSLGCRWLDLADGEYCEYRIKSHLYALLDKKIIMDRDVTDYRVINIEELRELAKPREYLDDKFELVVTNQPDGGWILVPDGADKFTPAKDGNRQFWINGLSHYENGTLAINGHEYSFYAKKWLKKILWQRENKVETVKGRFLHQEWYEAFGRGEDVQHTPCERDCDWTSTSIASPISIFSAREMKFRLKPQTIQIGSRTIKKPISVMPKKDQTYYVSALSCKDKYIAFVWRDAEGDNIVLNRKLCHLTADDAISMTDALLELMK